jgi:two-component system chemotaxis response regulator CheB
MTPHGKETKSDLIRIVVIHSATSSHDPIAEVIKSTADMQIVGIAKDLPAGLKLVRNLTPDIILMQDLPEVAEYTSMIRKEFPATGILLLSESSDPTSILRIVDALAAGAFDIVKMLEKNTGISSLLLSKIRCCSIKQYSQKALQARAFDHAAPSMQVHAIEPPFKKVPKRAFDAVLIGVSTGGPEALMELIAAIPASFPVPIVIVLHMPKEFTGTMATALDRKSKIHVTEATEGDILEAGRAYLAPGGQHCILEISENNHMRIHLNEDPHENGCRPSVDVLFRSAATILGKNGLAVILTGMGNDGTMGAGKMKHCGAHVLVQDELTSVVWGMPGSVARAGFADEILPLGKMASRLLELVGGS